MKRKTLIKQWMFPPEFQVRFSEEIAEIGDSINDALQNAKKMVEKVRQDERRRAEIEVQRQVAKEVGKQKTETEGLPAKIAISLCDELFRLRKNLNEMSKEGDSKDLRSARRNLRKLDELLQDNDVEIIEQTGEPYWPHMVAEVLAFEPTPGIEQYTITDTIRPAVLINKKMVRKAQIIVGTPETDEKEIKKNKEE